MTEPKEDYYRNATGWALRRQVADARSVRIAWTVAIIACGIIVVLAVALALLTPLKTVEPVTLLVDRQTGYVQALQPLQPQRLSADGALTQSFLVQYVIAREGFDRATLKRDYRKVALWSADTARDGYLAAMTASNPDSPLNRLPADALVEVQVKSVTPLDRGLAQVRFATKRNTANGATEPERAWVAIIGYRFTDAPMSMEDRFVNPLGFQVTSYRRAAEALPAYREPDPPAPPKPTPTPTIQASTTAVPAGGGDVAILVPRRSVPMGSPLGAARP